MTTNPRSIATAARGTVIVGSGLALGILSSHLYGQAVITATDNQTQSARATKPKVVTINRIQHVKSDPIIVYRLAPADGSSDGSPYVPPAGSGSSSNSGGENVAPAPTAPKPAPAARPAAKSKAS